MIGPLARWVRSHRMIVFGLLLLAGMLASSAVLVYRTVMTAFTPAPPAIVSVVAAFDGASAEEVEGQVTIPLEVALAGMPRLKAVYSQSHFGLSHLDCEFEVGADYGAARQEVINRLQFLQNLPPGVSPLLSPHNEDPVLRYTLSNASDALGRDLYTLGDLRALQDWNLERIFRRQPFVVDVASRGGAGKRYEIVVDPERLLRYGVTLQQLRDCVHGGNGNAGGDFLFQGRVRAIGVIGGGGDPMEKALGMKTAEEAARYLRAADQKRLDEIRGIVVTSVNNIPLRIDDVLHGGPLGPGQAEGKSGVVVGQRPRTGRVSVSRLRRDAQGAPIRDAGGKADWIIEPDTVQGIVLKRKDPDASLRPDLSALITELNNGPGQLLPGVKLITHPGPETGIFIHGLYPSKLDPDQVAGGALRVHAVLREFPEVATVVSDAGSEEFQVGLANEVEFFVALKSPAAWPVPAGRDRPRTRDDFLEDVRAELTRQFPDVDWYGSPGPGLKSMEPFAAAGDECLVKVFGPDLLELEKLAGRVKQKLSTVKGIGTAVRLFPIVGQTSVEFLVDRDKCSRWGVQVADVNTVIAMAGGTVISRMVEGDKTFDIVLRWPAARAGDVGAFLDLPVNAGIKVLRLRDLVGPVDPAPEGGLRRTGPATIYRENGNRLIALKFRVTGRSVAAALAEAQGGTADLFLNPYRAAWHCP